MLLCLPPVLLIHCCFLFVCFLITGTPTYHLKCNFETNQKSHGDKWTAAETQRSGIHKPHYQKVLCPNRSRAISSKVLGPAWGVLSFHKKFLTLGHWTKVQKHFELGKYITFLTTKPHSRAKYDIRPPFHRLDLHFQTKPNDFHWCSNVKRIKTRETTKPTIIPWCKIWRIYLHQVQWLKSIPNKQKVKMKQLLQPS